MGMPQSSLQPAIEYVAVSGIHCQRQTPLFSTGQSRGIDESQIAYRPAT